MNRSLQGKRLEGSFLFLYSLNGDDRVCIMKDFLESQTHTHTHDHEIPKNVRVKNPEIHGWFWVDHKVNGTHIYSMKEKVSRWFCTLPTVKLTWHPEWWANSGSEWISVNKTWMSISQRNNNNITSFLPSSAAVGLVIRNILSLCLSRHSLN